MARPRTIADQRLIEAAGVVIGRSGPGFTLAEVAREAGVSVGTVAGRFGSKHGLLLALSTAGTAQVVHGMRTAADAAASPFDALRDATVTAYAGLGDAETAANHLGQLGVDIGDPELRALLAVHYTAVEAELARCADLAGLAEPRRAARVLLGLIGGISIDWSVRPHGTLAERLREDVTMVLEGWKT